MRLDELLQLLPPNSLYRFQYDPVHLPSWQQLVYLWKHQRRLTNLHLDFSLSPHQLSSTAVEPFIYHRTALGPLRSDSTRRPPASLEPDNAQYDGCTLQLAVQENSQLLRALTDVRELHIDLGGMEDRLDYQRILEIVLNDRLEKITYRASRIPVYKPILQLPALRHLAFHFTMFCCPFVPNERVLPNLTHLELVECRRVERLVYMLDTSNLVSLIYQHACSEATVERIYGDTVSVLDIIESSNGLERLVLDCPKCIIGRLRPKLEKSISTHKSSLTSLLISCFYLPRAEMQLVLSAIHECRKLKQLSIPLDSDPSNLFDDYKVGRYPLSK